MNSSPSQRLLPDLIDRIYDAALSAESWPAALTQVSSSLGVACCTIVPLRDPASVIVSSGLEEAHEAYAQHWWRHDVISEAFARVAPTDPCHDWDLIGPEERARSPFYHEFRRPFGLGSCISTVSGGRSEAAFSVSVHLFGATSAQPDSPVTDRFRDVSRHISRAFAITQRTATLLCRDQALVELLCHVPYGVAVLDGRGRVVMANAALEAVSADVLRIIQGELRAARPKDQPPLNALIRASIDPALAGGDPDTVLLRRQSGARSLLLSAMPLARRHRTDTATGGLPQCRALIVAVDLEAETSAGVRQSLQLLDLTPAEARLAALVGTGRSPRQAAMDLGIAESTARSCLRQVFDKLEISRQSELARLLARLSLLPARRATEMSVDVPTRRSSERSSF